MKKILLLLLVVASITPALSQTSITGRVIDGEDGALPSATAMLMNSDDSLLVSFVLTDIEGNFEFKRVLKGNYYVQLSYLQYDMLKVPVEVDGSKEAIDLGKVIMTPEGTRLESVEITAEIIPVLIKGDTIEYNAKAFTTRPNDNVEQLLKQLPGVEVDGDGNIKAQGETVERILVDGKEFFGNDPKTASKNLPADAVDKVQVFDKMSDIAEFTGIDDGERQKTINLALKEDRKTGYFGNVGGGYGTKDRFEGKVNLNRFSPKTQISLLGMANNTNDQPFSVMDYINFMGGIQNVMSQGGFGRGGGGGGGLSPSDLGISSWGSTGLNNNGIATSAASGLNFNTDIGKRWEIQSSYFYSFLNNDIDKMTLRETVTEEQTFVTNEDNVRDDDNHNHRVNLYAKVKVDSLSELVLRGSGRFNDANGINSLLSSNGLENEPPRTTSSQDVRTLGSLLNTDDALIYRRKLRKPGRNFTLQGDFSYQDDGSDYFLDSYNAFDANGIVITDTINQDQFQDVTSLVWGGRGTYTEPLGNGRFLQAAYRHIENNYYLDKDFFDITENDSTFNPVLSNEFESLFKYDRGGLTFQQNRKKYNLALGLDYQRAVLEGDLIAADTTFRKEFNNVLPSLRFNYEFRKGRRIRVRYEPSVNAPSITQLQPVIDNSNPLNVYSGNPDLRAEYAHTLNTNFIFFDQFSFTSLFAGLRAVYTTNKINNATTIDTVTFRQFTSPVNVDDDLRLTLNLHFGTPIRKLKVKMNLDGNVSYNRGYTFINNIENLTNRLTSYGDFRLENRKKEHFDVRAGAKLTHSITAYEVNNEFDQSFLNATYYADASVNFWKKKFTLESSIQHNEYLGGVNSDLDPVTLWRGGLSYRFLKAERGLLKFSTFDLLKQNVGINRTIEQNFEQTETIVTLNRYYMLSFTYSIVAMGRKK